MQQKAVERQFDISTKALFHVMFGDKSTVFDSKCSSALPAFMFGSVLTSLLQFCIMSVEHSVLPVALGLP